MEDIFIKNLPFIDLHGYDIESATNNTWKGKRTS